MSNKNLVVDSAETENAFSGFIKAAGTILAVSYPILAISTGFRAGLRLYRLANGDTQYEWVPVLLSLLAALLYLGATVGFTKREKWAWQVSVGLLGFETLMTFIIGGMSLYGPTADIVGNTVWRLFGADYGYLPLIQPLLGIAWLFHPSTLAAYGIRKNSS